MKGENMSINIPINGVGALATTNARIECPAPDENATTTGEKP